MREMTEAGTDTWPQGRPCTIHVEEDLRIDKNEWNIKGRLRDRSKRIKYYKSYKKRQSMRLTEDILGTKQLDVDDLSLCNGNIVLPQNETAKPIIDRRSSVENLNAPVRVPLRKRNKRPNTNTLCKSKRLALTTNAAKLWDIKYNPILKAEAWKNAKNLKVCLKNIAPYDRNANVVSVCDKLQSSGINNLKQNAEDKVVSSINLRADSNVGFRASNTSVASNNNKYDPCISFNTFKDRRKNNEYTDIEHCLSRLKRFSTTITPVPIRIDNCTSNAQISNTGGNQNLKEKSTVLETNEKQDLLLIKEAKDHDSVLNRITCERVGKTRKNLIVTETTVLPTNTIKISDDGQGTDLSGILLKSSPEFSISKCKSHNTCTEINKKAELLSIVDDNVFKNGNEKSTDNSGVQAKDSVKKNCVNAKANNNKKNSSTLNRTAYKSSFSTKVSNEVCNGKFHSEYSSIRDNITTAVPAQVLPPSDRTTDTTVDTTKCSNDVSTATWMTTESSLSSNNALKQRAECGVVDRQKIVSTKEETEKISTKAENLCEKVNLSKAKRANSNQSIGNKGPKRIKLDRSLCLRNFGRKRENDDVCDNTGSVMASTAGTVPQMVIAGSSKATIVAHVPETKSKNEKAILNLVEEKASTSFDGTNKEDSDSPQNVWKLSEITSETPKSPAKHKFVVAGKTSCDSETATDDEYNDTDTDCISLYADSTLMAEYDTPVISAQPNSHKSLVRSEKPYVMTNDVIKNYFKSTASEFNRVYDTIINADSGQNTITNTDKIPVALRLSMPVTKEIAPVIPWVHQNPHNRGTGKVARPCNIPFCFRGYCHRYIWHGNCGMEACKFDHNFLELMIKLYVDGDRCLFEVIDKLVLLNCVSFLFNIYETLVMRLYADTIFVLKMLKKLYESNLVINQAAEQTILEWERNNISMEIVVNNLARIVDHNDSNFVNYIVKILQNHITHHIINGTYWNTLRALLLQVPNLEPEIITIIVRECVTTRKNVHDVHRNIVIKLDNQVRSAVDQKLWLRFNDLLKCTRENNTIKESSHSQSDIHIRSPDANNPVDGTERALTTSQHSETITTKVWTEFSPKTKERDDNNNAQNQSFMLRPIDDLPEPRSPHGRRIFWKFYLDVQSVQEGLKHDDYDHVMRILNAAKPTDKTVFSRECYKILCKEVKCSQSRLSKLISFAVQMGATPVLYEILLDVAIQILARLAEMELWVLALKLLEDVDIMIKIRIRLQETDAVTLLLIAEIYLANDQPVKAFTLLKQTNIISTNRSKWETPSNAKDDCIRAQVVALLLDRLCEMSPRHAIFLLEFLVADQPSNFSPVDLTRPAKKIVPAVLLGGDHESIINIGKLIKNYNFTLNTITYRALTAALVHIDKHLAMQFYQNAIGLGIYSNIRFHPATYVIIHSDWTNEEIYLVILDLMQQLSSNIGHAIDRIGLQQLSIYVNIETIPSETQLACDRGADEQYDNRIIESKKRIATILKKQFKPPILLAKSRNGKLCKLQNTSVRRYLQSEHPR